MVEVIMAFCWHPKFVPKRFSALAPGLYTCIKSLKMCIKSDFEEIIWNLHYTGKEKRPYCCHQNFVPKGLSVPALGLYTCIKALKYIPGPGVRWLFMDHWSSGLNKEQNSNEIINLILHKKYLVCVMTKPIFMPWLVSRICAVWSVSLLCAV